MRRVLLALAVALAVGGLRAERQPSFAVGAFNAAIPASDRTAVFSPFGFEIDSAVFSEASDTITKAKYVETLGALTGYDTVLLPIFPRYENARTNRFEYLSARAFLTPSFGRVKSDFRERMMADYSVATCLLGPTRGGAERWLEAMTEGLVGGDLLSEKDLAGKRVTFREAVYFHPCWQVSLKAAKPGFVTGEMPVDRWTQRRFALLRMPMSDGAWFYAIVPNAGIALDTVRSELTAERIDFLLAVTTSIVEPGVDHGVRKVTVPVMDVTSDTDLAPAFKRFLFPLGPFASIDAHEGMDTPRQRMRFVLDGEGAESLGERARGDTRTAAGEEIALDRPFVFFVWHQPTSTMPVAGVYTGDKK